MENDSSLLLWAFFFLQLCAVLPVILIKTARGGLTSTFPMQALDITKSSSPRACCVPLITESGVLVGWRNAGPRCDSGSIYMH